MEPGFEGKQTCPSPHPRCLASLPVIWMGLKVTEPRNVARGVMSLTHHLVHPLSSRRGTFQCWRGGGVGRGRRGRKHCFLPPWGFSSGLWHSIPTPPFICHFIEQLVLIECTWAETPPHIGPGQCFAFFFFSLLLWIMRGAPVPLRWRCLVKFPGRSANPPGTPLPWPSTELTGLHGGQPASL